MRIVRWLEAVAVAAVCLFGVYAINEARKEDRNRQERATRALEELAARNTQILEHTNKMLFAKAMDEGIRMAPWEYRKIIEEDKEGRRVLAEQEAERQKKK